MEEREEKKYSRMLAHVMSSSFVQVERGERSVKGDFQQNRARARNNMSFTGSEPSMKLAKIGNNTTAYAVTDCA